MCVYLFFGFQFVLNKLFKFWNADGWVADRMLHSRANLLFKLCRRQQTRTHTLHTHNIHTRDCIISKCLKGLKSKQQKQQQHEWNKPPQRFCLGCWWCTTHTATETKRGFPEGGAIPRGVLKGGLGQGFRMRLAGVCACLPHSECKQICIESSVTFARLTCPKSKEKGVSGKSQKNREVRNSPGKSVGES